MKSGLWVVLMLTAVSGLVMGCETEEDLKVYSARECIDYARTEAEADACIAQVNGIESSKAYLVRCSANFIAQGFTGQRFSRAFQRLKDSPTSGQDPMATAMSFLVFTKNSANHSPDRTVTNCTLAGSRSMLRLATMAKLATFIANPTSGPLSDLLNPESGSFDPAAINTAINNLVSGSAEDQATVGEIGAQVANAYCNPGSSFEDSEICKNLNKAISDGNGDAQATGVALLNQLLALAP